ncbi:MAG: hypothetical protein AB7O97_16865 [Planctomycetota bacterium]
MVDHSSPGSSRLLGPCCRSLATAVLLLGTTAAQEPSAWQSISPPGGVQVGYVGPRDYGNDAKLVVYRDGTYLRVFSAVTGRWHAFTPSFGTTVIHSDDLLLTPESDRWTAFSAWTGRFASLPVDFATVQMNFDESVAYVRDGGTVHAFSAFTGDWHPHQIPVGWGGALAQRTMVFVDGVGDCDGAAAFDAYTGTWHDLPGRAEPLEGGGLSGGSALLRFASAQYGFSSQRSAWIQLQATAGPGGFSGWTSQPGSDLVAVRSTVFSGITGTALNHPSSTAAGIRTEGLVGSSSVTGSPTFVCGPRDMTWVQAPPGIVRGYGTWVTASSGGQVYAFSGITNAFAGPVAASAQAGNTLVVAALPASGLIQLFSSCTGQWYAPPAGTASVSTVYDAAIGSTSVLLRTATGAVGFSARTGAFVPLTTGAALLQSGGGAVTAAIEGNLIHVFDAQKDRWLQAALTMGANDAPRFAWAPNGTTAVFRGAEGVIGFAARSGHLELLPLAEPVLDRDAGGHHAWAKTATQLHAFAGFPAIAPWFGLPETWAGCGVGTTMRMQVRLPQGDAALVGIGPHLPAPVALPFGDLWIDPAFSEIRFALPDPGEDRAVLALPIPNLPLFHGTEWFMQALIAPAGGAVYLTDPTTIRVL